MCCTDEDFDNIIENQKQKCYLPIFDFVFFIKWHLIIFCFFDYSISTYGCGLTPGVGDGQGGLACYSSLGLKESDTTERQN